MTVFDTRALARPLFTDADFIATKWDGAAEKAAFANALCRFMSATSGSRCSRRSCTGV